MIKYILLTFLPYLFIMGCQKKATFEAETKKEKEGKKTTQTKSQQIDSIENSLIKKDIT